MSEQNNFEALADTLLGSNDILSVSNDQCALNPKVDDLEDDFEDE